MNTIKQFTLSAIFIALCSPQSAIAKTPPNVLEAYKAYSNAMTQKDYKSAIKHAQKAWQEAETSLGDNVMTGDLAYNYAYVEKNQGTNKGNAIAAFQRSIELTHLNTSNATELRLEREVELISSMEGFSKDKKLEKQIKLAQKFAKSNGMQSSVFAGEILIHETNVCNRKLQSRMKAGTKQLGSLIDKGTSDKSIRESNEKCASIARRAVGIFEQNPDQTRPQYLASAHNYVGYGHEVGLSWFKAAMSYQKARNAIEGLYGKEDPRVARTIGRWLNARNFLKRKGRLAEAEANGLCKCWPYNKTRKTVPVTKWVEAKFPTSGYQRLSSGYAIVQMDVSDTGKAENVRILNSWPDDVYDKNSLKAAKQIEFEVKTGDEPADYRKGITVPFSYFLSSGLEPL